MDTFYTPLVFNTVNVEISTQYIFSRILRRTLGVRKLNVSENIIIIGQIQLTGMCAKINTCRFAS